MSTCQRRTGPSPRPARPARWTGRCRAGRPALNKRRSLFAIRDRSACPVSIQHACSPGDGLDWGVGVVARWDESAAAEAREDRLVIDGEERRLDIVFEAGAKDRVNIAANGPLIVGKGRRLPDDGDFALVDLAGLALEIPDRIVKCADFERPRLNELDCARVIAREPHARKDLL